MNGVECDFAEGPDVNAPGFEFDSGDVKSAAFTMRGGDPAERARRHMFGDETLEWRGVENRIGWRKAFEDIFVANGGVNLAQGHIILFFAEEGKDGDKRARADAGNDVEFWATAGGIAPAAQNAAAEGTLGIPAGENEDVFGRAVGKGGAEVSLKFLIALEGEILSERARLLGREAYETRVAARAAAGQEEDKCD